METDTKRAANAHAHQTEPTNTGAARGGGVGDDDPCTTSASELSLLVTIFCTMLPVPVVAASSTSSSSKMVRHLAFASLADMMYKLLFLANSQSTAHMGRMSYHIILTSLHKSSFGFDTRLLAISIAASKW